MRNSSGLDLLSVLYTDSKPDVFYLLFCRIFVKCVCERRLLLFFFISHANVYQEPQNLQLQHKGKRLGWKISILSWSSRKLTLSKLKIINIPNPKAITKNAKKNV